MKLFFPTLALVLFACRSEDGVKAYNAQPQVTITSHTDGAQIQDGYVISFIGQVSDANHQNTDLLVTWSTNNGDLCTEMIPETNGETICEASSRKKIQRYAYKPSTPKGVPESKPYPSSSFPPKHPKHESSLQYHQEYTTPISSSPLRVPSTTQKMMRNCWCQLGKHNRWRTQCRIRCKHRRFRIGIRIPERRRTCGGDTC